MKESKRDHIFLSTTSPWAKQGHSCAVHWQLERSFALYVRVKFKIKLDWSLKYQNESIIKMRLVQLKFIAKDSIQSWRVSEMS